MSGKKGRSGRNRQTLYSRVYRIRVTREHRDLLPFFKQLDALPPDRRNGVLLAAIRGGTARAQSEAMSPRTSGRASRAIDAIANAFGE